MRRFPLLLVLFLFLLLVPTASALPHDSYPSFAHPQSRVSLGASDTSITISDTIIYNTAYYNLPETNDWVPFSLGNNFYPGSDSWLDSVGFSDSLPEFPANNESYILFYSCTFISAQDSDPASNWDCHNATGSPNGFWQLVVINNSVVDSVAQDFFLVQNNVPLADIVVSPSAPNMVQLAAQYFQSDIFEMTGANLSISDSPNASFDFHVYIGESQYTRDLGVTCAACEYDAYKVVSGNDYLVLLGDDGPFSGEYCGFQSTNYPHMLSECDSRGSMNAVHDFLYDQGMRWYYPSEFGTVTPLKQDISFAPVNKLVNPDFPLRHPFIYYKAFGHLHRSLYPHFESILRWQLSLGFNSQGDFTPTGLVHGIGLVVSTRDAVLYHPEYFAVRDGVLKNGFDFPCTDPYNCGSDYITIMNDTLNCLNDDSLTCPPHALNQTSQVPDLCSPELFEDNVQYIRDLIETQNATLISVMPTDGFPGASAFRPECLAQQTPERGSDGMLSDYVWEYVNNVAWAIYDEYGAQRRIIGGAYALSQLPPEKLSKPLAPNLAVILTKWRTWSIGEEDEAYYQNLTATWLQMLPSKELYTYDYYLQNRQGSATQSYPAFFPQLIASDLLFLKDKSLGEFIEVYTEWPDFGLTWDPFAAQGLNVYVTGKLYWDVDLDIDALLDEYYELYYGPASAQMKAVVEYAEANIDLAATNPLPLKNLRAMVVDALEIAGPETVYGQRIDVLLGLINSNFVSDEVYLDDCQTLDSPATTYYLTQDIFSDNGTCFDFYADGVTLDCQGHTIAYALDGVRADDHAIVINEWYSYRGDYFTINNCVIQDGSYDSGNTTGSAIYMNVADMGYITNTFINVSGAAIFTLGSSLNHYLNNEIYAGSGNAFYSQFGSWSSEGGISNNTFIDNYFYSRDSNAAYLYRSKYDVIVNNTFISDNTAALNTFSPVNLTMQGNTIIDGS